MKRYFRMAFWLLGATACSSNKPASDPSESYAAMEPASATAPAPTESMSTNASGDPMTSDATDTSATDTTRPSGAATEAKRTDSADAPMVAAAPAANETPVAADNTKKNQRDTKASALTPMDQGNGETDLTITQKIRQAVMDDGSLSFTAKNVKIITVKGKVTLRGPVNNAAERASIEAAARRVAGASMVDNQLEVKK